MLDNILPPGRYTCCALTDPGEMMTVAQAIALLAKLPNDAPLCFCTDDYAGTLAEITQIEIVLATSDGEAFIATFDAAADGTTRVAVVD
jgi:hypothetical protein